MKLKKIASLMLAGVMAISMLAGCSNGNGGKDEGTVVVPSDLTGKVIAALDEDTTKTSTFASDADLATAVEKAVKNLGAGAPLSNVNILNQLKKINSDYAKELVDATSATSATEDEVKKDGSQTFVQVMKGEGYSEEYAVIKLAGMIDKGTSGGVAWSGVPENSKDYDSGKYWYSLDYATDIAVVAVSDAVTGQTQYVVAFTVNRTATKVEK